MANIQCLIWPSTCLYSLLDSWLKMLCPCCEETHLFMRGKVRVTLCLYRQNSIGNIFDIIKLSLGVWVVVLRSIVSSAACTLTEAFTQSSAFLMMVTLSGCPCLRSLIMKLGRLYSTHRNFENQEQSQKNWDSSDVWKVLFPVIMPTNTCLITSLPRPSKCLVRS